MPFTFKDYPVLEMAIALTDRSDDAHEHVQEGDIVAIRAPADGIGTEETKRFLWIRVQGWDFSDLYRLTSHVTEPMDDEGQTKTPAFEPTDYDKRRYCIPLPRLKQAMPSLDLAKARDLNVIHQPGLPVSEDPPHFYLDGLQMKPLPIEGLIFDKAIGNYLSGPSRKI